ncbi:hypothetical protein GE061_010136 [Apolygus lucorum]|uniref:Uncharacterized protein n=1 Tax=Apolygus lucorum TaxID=248454 RepID=A0A8S9Y3H1_APOLU|nr:hypothetical protein GE061_010136 [Apolygus lucorum]
MTKRPTKRTTKTQTATKVTKSPTTQRMKIPQTEEEDDGGVFDVRVEDDAEDIYDDDEWICPVTDRTKTRPPSLKVMTTSPTTRKTMKIPTIGEEDDEGVFDVRVEDDVKDIYDDDEWITPVTDRPKTRPPSLKVMTTGPTTRKTMKIPPTEEEDDGGISDLTGEDDAEDIYDDDEWICPVTDRTKTRPPSLKVMTTSPTTRKTMKIPTTGEEDDGDVFDVRVEDDVKDIYDGDEGITPVTDRTKTRPPSLKVMTTSPTTRKTMKIPTTGEEDDVGVFDVRVEDDVKDIYDDDEWITPVTDRTKTRPPSLKVMTTSPTTRKTMKIPTTGEEDDGDVFDVRVEDDVKDIYDGDEGITPVTDRTKTRPPSLKLMTTGPKTQKTMKIPSSEEDDGGISDVTGEEDAEDIDDDNEWITPVTDRTKTRPPSLKVMTTGPTTQKTMEIPSTEEEDDGGISDVTGEEDAEDIDDDDEWITPVTDRTKTRPPSLKVMTTGPTTQKTVEIPSTEEEDDGVISDVTGEEDAKDIDDDDEWITPVTDRTKTRPPSLKVMTTGPTTQKTMEIPSTEEEDDGGISDVTGEEDAEDIDDDDEWITAVTDRTKTRPPSLKVMTTGPTTQKTMEIPSTEEDDDGGISDVTGEEDAEVIDDDDEWITPVTDRTKTRPPSLKVMTTGPTTQKTMEIPSTEEEDDGGISDVTGEEDVKDIHDDDEWITAVTDRTKTRPPSLKVMTTGPTTQKTMEIHSTEEEDDGGISDVTGEEDVKDIHDDDEWITAVTDRTKTRPPSLKVMTTGPTTQKTMEIHSTEEEEDDGGISDVTGEEDVKDIHDDDEWITAVTDRTKTRPPSLKVMTTGPTTQKTMKIPSTEEEDDGGISDVTGEEDAEDIDDDDEWITPVTDRTKTRPPCLRVMPTGPTTQKTMEITSTEEEDDGATCVTETRGPLLQELWKRSVLGQLVAEGTADLKKEQMRKWIKEEIESWKGAPEVDHIIHVAKKTNKNGEVYELRFKVTNGDICEGDYTIIREGHKSQKSHQFECYKEEIFRKSLHAVLESENDQPLFGPKETAEKNVNELEKQNDEIEERRRSHKHKKKCDQISSKTTSVIQKIKLHGGGTFTDDKGIKRRHGSQFLKNKLKNYHPKVVKDTFTLNKIQQQIDAWPTEPEVDRLIKVTHSVDGKIEIYSVTYKAKNGDICEGEYSIEKTAWKDKDVHHNFECHKEAPKRRKINTITENDEPMFRSDEHVREDYPKRKRKRHHSDDGEEDSTEEDGSTESEEGEIHLRSEV